MAPLQLAESLKGLNAELVKDGNKLRDKVFYFQVSLTISHAVRPTNTEP